MKLDRSREDFAVGISRFASEIERAGEKGSPAHSSNLIDFAARRYGVTQSSHDALGILTFRIPCGELPRRHNNKGNLLIDRQACFVKHIKVEFCAKNAANHRGKLNGVGIIPTPILECGGGKRRECNYGVRDRNSIISCAISDYRVVTARNDMAARIKITTNENQSLDPTAAGVLKC